MDFEARATPQANALPPAPANWPTGTPLPVSRIPDVIAEAYASAPSVIRLRVLECLLRPLNLFSLLVVANGIFAKAWLRCPGQGLHLQISDVQNVCAADVSSLVEYVQQVNVDVIYGLAGILASSPLLAGSSAVALLLRLLLRRRNAASNASGDSRMRIARSAPNQLADTGKAGE